MSGSCQEIELQCWQEFELDIVDVSMGLPIVIGVPGWLNDSQDNAWKVWDEALCGAVSDGGALPSS
jgi:hypothetical protein